MLVTPDPSGPGASSGGGQRHTCLRAPSKRDWQDTVWRRVSSCCVRVPRPRDNGLRSTLAWMYGFGTCPTGERKGDLGGFHGADKIPTPGTELGSTLPGLGQMPEVSDILGIAWAMAPPGKSMCCDWRVPMSQVRPLHITDGLAHPGASHDTLPTSPNFRGWPFY